MGPLEVQLVDVAEGSSRTVWKLEGKQVRFLHYENKVRSMRSTDNDDVVGLGSRKAKVLFLIMKRKVRSIRSTDNGKIGLVGSLKTCRWFG